MNLFEDEDFQDCLVALLCRDPQVLAKCGGVLQPDDFKPLRGHRHGHSRWVVASAALQYYNSYREPAGKLLAVSVREYAKRIALGARPLAQLQTYLKHLQGIQPPVAAIVDKVLDFKGERLRAGAVQELVDALSNGELTAEKWEEVHGRLTTSLSGEVAATDYLSEMENRISRRHLQGQTSRVPMLLVEPLDTLVCGIGPGQLGLALAPPKRGKSLFLLWLAVAYMLQRLNVLFLTLEDPQVDMEDRLDAIISGIRLQRLNEKPRLFRERFAKFTRLLHSRLRIVDGTQGGITVPRIEQILLQERDHGFYADVVIVDYDDEIAPTKKKTERRFELADVYRDLRQLASRQKLIVWTAAQTQRGTEGLKILSGDRIAEDISKIRKVTLAIGLGQGDWGPESIYLWVAAHKFDRQHVGCHIMADRPRMLIYDAEKTRKAAQTEADMERSE